MDFDTMKLKSYLQINSKSDFTIFPASRTKFLKTVLKSWSAIKEIIILLENDLL
jgi:hypothetical protein